MHTPAPSTSGLRTTEVTYPSGTEYIRASALTCAHSSMTAHGRMT